MKDKRVCRTCKHFHRVGENGLRNIQNAQGFCTMGQLDGDFGLYVSSTKSRTCMAYVEDEYNLETYALEQALKITLSDFRRDVGGARTKVYMEILIKWFFEKNIEQYRKIGNRKLTPHKQYCELVGRITKEFFDEFEGLVKNE